LFNVERLWRDAEYDRADELFVDLPHREYVLRDDLDGAAPDFDLSLDEQDLVDLYVVLHAVEHGGEADHLALALKVFNGGEEHGFAGLRTAPLDVGDDPDETMNGAARPSEAVSVAVAVGVAVAGGVLEHLLLEALDVAEAGRRKGAHFSGVRFERVPRDVKPDQLSFVLQEDATWPRRHDREVGFESRSFTDTTSEKR